MGRNGEEADAEYFYARLALELFGLTPDQFMAQSRGSYIVSCATIDLILEDRKKEAKRLKERR